MLTPPPVEIVEIVEVYPVADGVWKPPPVEMVEMVEVASGGDTGCSASLRLAGPGSASRVPPPAEFVEFEEVSSAESPAAAQGQATARW